VKTTDPACGKSWAGYRAEHCTICHETFSGTTAGDKHRQGPFTARICAPPDSVGLHRDPQGIWRLPGSPRGTDGAVPWEAS